MNALRAPFENVAQAWGAYLEFSPFARGVLEPDLNDSRFLQLRGKKGWSADFQQRTQSGSQTPLDTLRIWKKEEIVRLGFLEFATDVSMQSAALALSDLADFCLENVLNVVLQKYSLAESTLAVIGLGKLGGGELNYSSDIDLMFIYGEEGETASGKTLHDLYNRIVREVVQELTKSSAHGQLYRVDLRLRPEGDRGPLARSVESCENYYAEFGEIWERLALLKARGSAGEAETAYDFLTMMQSFCYAKDLLPELLGEIAALKKRTEEEIVGEENQDYHVKLGRGGIRDIEFFVQGQQLFHGARQSYLQQPNTFKALDALLHLNFIERERYHTLKSAYGFWRRLEHRIQIVDHRQTHLLPRNQDALLPIARSLGYESCEELWEAQLARRKEVRNIYDEFYGGLEKKISPTADSFFDASVFNEPEQACRHWESLIAGSSEFHVSRRTQTSFQRLAPYLTQFLKQQALRPDVTLVQFVGFVEAYGSRSLLYESLVSNPRALELLLKLFDSSHYLGETLRACPEVFEEVARGGLDEPRDAEIYLHALLEMDAGLPADTARIYKRQEMVRIALRWLLDLAPLETLFEEFTALADACLCYGWQALGKPKLAVIALGKHGGCELGFGSDLDVLFVGEDYEAAQKWVSFMAEQRMTGSLFEVDARLRPFGEGKLARSVDEYVDYYAGQAQVWEIQALTKARFAGGNEAMGREFLSRIQSVWQKRCETPNLAEELLLMRQKIVEGRSKTGRPELEFKTGAGGMMDVEFAIQYQQMRRKIFEPRFQTALEKMDLPEKEKLMGYYRFFRTVEAWLRFDRNARVSHLPLELELRNQLSRRLGMGDEGKLMRALGTVYEDTRRIFLRWMNLK